MMESGATASKCKKDPTLLLPFGQFLAKLLLVTHLHRPAKLSRQFRFDTIGWPGTRQPGRIHLRSMLCMTGV